MNIQVLNYFIFKKYEKILFKRKRFQCGFQEKKELTKVEMFFLVTKNINYMSQLKSKRK